MYTKILIIILIILVILIYIYYYNNYKSDYNILQTYLNEIDLNLVYEKYPIVIYDKVINPHELLNTLFMYTYLFKKEAKIKPIYPTINQSKHIILWNPNVDILVNIINPKYSKVIKWHKNNGYKISTSNFIDNNKIQYITIKLKANQILILPAFWIFQCIDFTNIIQLDDLISVCIF